MLLLFSAFCSSSPIDARPTRCSHLLSRSQREDAAIPTPWRRRGPTKAVAAAVGTFAPADGLLPDAARGCERLAERGGSPARRAAWRAACCGSSRHSARYSYPARGDQRAIRAIEQQPIGAGCHACSDQGRRPHSRRRARASVSGDGLQRSPYDQVCVCVCVVPFVRAHVAQLPPPTMTMPHAADTVVPGARNVASLHAVSRTSPFTHGQNAVMQPWTSSRVAKPRRCRAREGRRCASAGPKKGGDAPTGRWRTLVAWGRCGSPSKLCWAACRPAGRCSRGLIAGCQRPWWPLITGLAAEALLDGSAGWRPTIKRNGPSYEGVPTNSASAFGSIEM